MCKEGRLHHLLGLGVEFTSSEGVAAWVGSPLQDQARVSFAVQVGKSRQMTVEENSKEWYQKLSLKQWRGFSHQIDDPLRVLAKQSLDRLRNGEEDVDLVRRQMIAARIEVAKAVMPVTTEEQQARMPFRNKEQKILLRKRSRLEAALRETTTGQDTSLIQLACMYDLSGLTIPLRLPLQDKEILVDTPQWRALVRAEIQNSKNKLDKIAQKPTRKCET
jgi:hypothetical protein